MSMTIHQKLNRIEHELNTLFDGFNNVEPVEKLVFERIMEDLKEIQSEAGTMENTKFLQNELDVTKRELTTVRRQLEKLTAGNLRLGTTYKMLTEPEIGMLDGAGKLDEFLMRIDEKQWILAIKIWRGVFGSGLSEAKQRIEQLNGGIFR